MTTPPPTASIHFGGTMTAAEGMAIKAAWAQTDLTALVAAVGRTWPGRQARISMVITLEPETVTQTDPIPTESFLNIWNCTDSDGNPIPDIEAP